MNARTATQSAIWRMHDCRAKHKIALERGVLRDGTEGFAMIFQKILCPTDFSEASLRGVQAAAEMARQNNTELCVLHVEPPLGSALPAASHIPYMQSDAARSATAITNLCRAIEERVPSAVHSHPLLKRGHTAEEIVHAAREGNADLIVLTTHGTTELRSGELGSVAAQVLQSSPCLVLSIRGLSGASTSPEELHKTKIAGAPALNQKDTSSDEAAFLDGDSRMEQHQ